jgi:hypothetical protein
VVKLDLLQEQQKNMVEQVGQHLILLNSARYGLGGIGIQTAALAFGGLSPESVTEEYDGNSWTTSNNFKYGKK